MQAIMDGLRTNPPQVIADLPVLSILDYGDGVPMTKINGNPDEHQVLPDANVISFDLGDGMRIIIRPSGTEPRSKHMSLARQIRVNRQNSFFKAFRRCSGAA